MASADRGVKWCRRHFEYIYHLGIKWLRDAYFRITNNRLSNVSNELQLCESLIIPLERNTISMSRTATVNRHTNETKIDVSINLDGSGEANLNTGIGFFDHMLDQIARHGLFDLAITCDGDLYVDCHHSVEDVGIALGQALRTALGDKRGINRYGHSYVPLDEALSRVVIDFSGRPGLHFYAKFSRDKIGEVDTETFFEFFQGFANHAQATIHIDNIRGINNHHIIETIFKAFGRALRMACSLDERAAGQMPSTKGCL